MKCIELGCFVGWFWCDLYGFCFLFWLLGWLWVVC